MATFESVDFNPMAASPLDFALNAEGIKGALADLARGVYQQESGSGKNIESAASRKSGARGGMQILPSTFASVADKDWNIDDPVQNARGGVRYLQQLYDQAGGDAKLAAIGYYGGPGAMAKARKGVAVSDPRNADAPTTLQYGDQVMANMARIAGANGGASAPPAPASATRPMPALPAIKSAARAPVALESVDFDPFAPSKQDVAAQQEAAQTEAGRKTRQNIASLIPYGGALFKALDIDPMTAIKAVPAGFAELGNPLVSGNVNTITALMHPWDTATNLAKPLLDKVQGIAPYGLTGTMGIQQKPDPNISPITGKPKTWLEKWNDERKGSLEDFNKGEEAGPDATAYKVLKEATKMAATLPVGGIAGNAIKAGAEAPWLLANAPKVAPWLGKLAAATEGGGFGALEATAAPKAVGLIPRAAQMAANTGTRAAGGAIQGAAQSAAMGEDPLTGGIVGAVVPTALRPFGMGIRAGGTAARDMFFTPQIAKDARKIVTDVGGYKTPEEIAAVEQRLRGGDPNGQQVPGARFPLQDVPQTVPQVLDDNARIAQLGRSLTNAGDTSLLTVEQAQDVARKGLIEGVAPTADTVGQAAADFGRVATPQITKGEQAAHKGANKLYSALDAATQDAGMTLPFDALEGTKQRLAGPGTVDTQAIDAVLGEANKIGKETIPGVKPLAAAETADNTRTLAQEVRAQGGIRNVNKDGTPHDLQGEIDHVRTFTKNIVSNQKGSKTIDDMAETLHQQGRLPDSDPDTLLNHLRDPDLANAKLTAVDDPERAFRAQFEANQGDLPTADTEIDKLVPFKQVRNLRISMGKAAEKAQQFGDTQQHAALVAMIEDLDKKMGDVAAGATLHPGEQLSASQLKAFQDAQAAWGKYQKTYHEGSVSPLFKVGGDGRPMKEGAELAPHFFSSRGSGAEDVQGLLGVADQQTLAALKSYATTGLAGKEIATTGDLSAAGMRKWIDAHDQALKTLMTPAEHYRLKAVVADAEHAARVKSLGKAVGSNTEQNQIATQMLGPGWLEHSVTKRIAGLGGELGKALQRNLAGAAAKSNVERIGELMANPDKLAEAVAAYRTASARAPFGASLGAKVPAAGYRLPGALLSAGINSRNN